VRALLSVSDKTDIVSFAAELHQLNFKLLSTGGTLDALTKAGVAAQKVSDYTQSPEIFGGRVKTLHPKIHGGLLVRPALASDASEMKQHGIEAIDVLAVNLYPFRETVAKGAPFEEVIENIDIGGPAMIRAAAKNASRVAVLVDPADYAEVIASLKKDKAVNETLRNRLMRKAFAHTAAYDASVAAYLNERGNEPFPDEMTVSGRKLYALRYGENPHQRAQAYALQLGASGVSVAQSKVLQGKELSYNNLLDLDAALGLVLEFPERPTAVVIKHNTPCGVASDSALAQAYFRARAIDEISAFGGIVALNRTVDEATARLLAETFLEAVIAPAFSSEARNILESKKNLRLLEAGAAMQSVSAAAQLDVRSISGGFLVMDRDAAEPKSEWKVVTNRRPSALEMESLQFAWRVCKHVKSNAIVFASSDQILAVGGGQTSRVDSVKIAATRGGERLIGSSVASDAFFPFRDGLDALAAAGAKSVIQPGGSMRDEEVIAAANAHDIAMVFTGVRHFKH
jgi:phosphoribosylaminoimidazolecarboxamide formyltransferase / IMP cyclohydrolase